MRDAITVLVVDDDRRMVKTISDILRIKGFKAEPAYSGEEAVEKVMSMDFDCVLMDLKMPEIDGVEALKLIKEQAPGLPVVMMSAYATEEQANEAKGEGAYSILAKPIDVQQMLSFLSMLRKEESILIVDDDPLFCSTLSDILQARGYQVESEGDPDEVLAHLEQKYQLVVILDLKLGSADGVETLERIRARYPTKPVILATGYRQEMMASIEKGFRIGAHACIYKPYETNELLEMIEHIHHQKLRTFLGEAE